MADSQLPNKPLPLIRSLYAVVVQWTVLDGSVMQKAPKPAEMWRVSITTVLAQ